MARVLFTWFKHSDPRDKTPLIPSSSYSTTELASLLLPSLVVNLEELQRSLEEEEEEESISLHWCGKAMLLVKKMHYYHLLLSSVDQVKTLDEYMGESLDLLDLCIMLKTAISRRLMVDYALKRFSLEKVEMGKLMVREGEEEDVTVVVFDVHKWKDKIGKLPKTKLSSTSNIISSTITTICLLIIFCSLLDPIFSKEIHRELVINLKSFTGSLRKLIGCFCEGSSEMGIKSVVFEDIMMVEKTIAELKLVQTTQGKGFEKQVMEIILEVLGKRSAALKEGSLDLLESIVDEVFEDVVKGRRQVLELIMTDKHMMHRCM
ncbi:hypothetical protein Dimus_006772 [Dionaea muscipula]